MRLRRPLPAVQGDTLHIVGVGDNRIGKGCCSRHVRPLVYDGWRGWLRTQPMSDTTVTGRPRPGSHQVTMSVEVGTSTGCPRVADMSGE